MNLSFNRHSSLVILVLVGVSLLIVSTNRTKQQDTPSETQTAYVESALFDQTVDELEFIGRESDRILGPTHSVYHTTVDGEHYRVKVYDNVLNGQYRTDITPWTNASQ